MVTCRKNMLMPSPGKNSDDAHGLRYSETSSEAVNQFFLRVDAFEPFCVLIFKQLVLCLETFLD